MKRAGLLAAVFMSAVRPANADPYSDEVGKCFVRATSSDDRAVLVKSSFAALALNPTVAPMFHLTSAERSALKQAGIDLHIRLATQDCRKQTLDALRYEGPSAVVSGFKLLAGISMRGLISDSAVHADILSSDQAFMNGPAMKDVVREAGQSPTP